MMSTRNKGFATAAAAACTLLVAAGVTSSAVAGVGYPAKPGYDLVTGVGTIDAARFVPELARLG
jgi:hypothetical protein